MQIKASAHRKVQHMGKMVDELWAAASSQLSLVSVRGVDRLGEEVREGPEDSDRILRPGPGGATGTRTENQDIYLRCSGTQTEPHTAVKRRQRQSVSQTVTGAGSN